jgi:hypothetical protein
VSWPTAGIARLHHRFAFICTDMWDCGCSCSAQHQEAVSLQGMITTVTADHGATANHVVSRAQVRGSCFYNAKALSTGTADPTVCAQNLARAVLRVNGRHRRCGCTASHDGTSRSTIPGGKCYVHIILHNLQPSHRLAPVAVLHYQARASVAPMPTTRCVRADALQGMSNDAFVYSTLVGRVSYSSTLGGHSTVPEGI